MDILWNLYINLNRDSSNLPCIQGERIPENTPSNPAWTVNGFMLEQQNQRYRYHTGQIPSLFGSRVEEEYIRNAYFNSFGGPRVIEAPPRYYGNNVNNCQTMGSRSSRWNNHANEKRDLHHHHQEPRYTGRINKEKDPRNYNQREKKFQRKEIPPKQRSTENSRCLINVKNTEPKKSPSKDTVKELDPVSSCSDLSCLSMELATDEEELDVNINTTDVPENITPEKREINNHSDLDEGITSPTDSPEYEETTKEKEENVVPITDLPEKDSYAHLKALKTDPRLHKNKEEPTKEGLGKKESEESHKNEQFSCKIVEKSRLQTNIEQSSFDVTKQLTKKVSEKFVDPRINSKRANSEDSYPVELKIPYFWIKWKTNGMKKIIEKNHVNGKKEALSKKTRQIRRKSHVCVENVKTLKKYTNFTKSKELMDLCCHVSIRKGECERYMEKNKNLFSSFLIDTTKTYLLNNIPLKTPLVSEKGADGIGEMKKTTHNEDKDRMHVPKQPINENFSHPYPPNMNSNRKESPKKTDSPRGTNKKDLKRTHKKTPSKKYRDRRDLYYKRKILSSSTPMKVKPKVGLSFKSKIFEKRQKSFSLKRKSVDSTSPGKENAIKKKKVSAESSPEYLVEKLNESEEKSHVASTKTTCSSRDMPDISWLFGEDEKETTKTNESDMTSENSVSDRVASISSEEADSASKKNMEYSLHIPNEASSDSFPFTSEEIIQMLDDAIGPTVSLTNDTVSSDNSKTSEALEHQSIEETSKDDSTPSNEEMSITDLEKILQSSGVDKGEQSTSEDKEEEILLHVRVIKSPEVKMEAEESPITPVDLYGIQPEIKSEEEQDTSGSTQSLEDKDCSNDGNKIGQASRVRFISPLTAEEILSSEETTVSLGSKYDRETVEVDVEMPSFSEESKVQATLEQSLTSSTDSKELNESIAAKNSDRIQTVTMLPIVSSVPEMTDTVDSSTKKAETAGGEASAVTAARMPPLTTIKRVSKVPRSALANYAAFANEIYKIVNTYILVVTRNSFILETLKSISNEVDVERDMTNYINTHAKIKTVYAGKLLKCLHALPEYMDCGSLFIYQIMEYLVQMIQNSAAKPLMSKYIWELVLVHLSKYDESDTLRKFREFVETDLRAQRSKSVSVGAMTNEQYYMLRTQISQYLRMWKNSAVRTPTRGSQKDEITTPNQSQPKTVSVTPPVVPQKDTQNMQTVPPPNRPYTNSQKNSQPAVETYQKLFDHIQSPNFRERSLDSSFAESNESSSNEPARKKRVIRPTNCNKNSPDQSQYQRNMQGALGPNYPELAQRLNIAQPCVQRNCNVFNCAGLQPAAISPNASCCYQTYPAQNNVARFLSNTASSGTMMYNQNFTAASINRTLNTQNTVLRNNLTSPQTSQQSPNVPRTSQFNFPQTQNMTNTHPMTSPTNHSVYNSAQPPSFNASMKRKLDTTNATYLAKPSASSILAPTYNVPAMSNFEGVHAAPTANASRASLYAKTLMRAHSRSNPASPSDLPPSQNSSPKCNLEKVQAGPMLLDDTFKKPVYPTSVTKGYARSNSTSPSVPTYNTSPRSDSGCVHASSTVLNSVTLSRSNSLSPTVPKYNAPLRSNFGNVQASAPVVNDACTANLMKSTARSNSASPSVPAYNSRSDFGGVNSSSATLNNVTLSRSNSASSSVPTSNASPRNFGGLDASSAAFSNATLSRSNSASPSVPTHNVRTDFGAVNPSQATLNYVTLSRSNSASPSVPTSNASPRNFGGLDASSAAFSNATLSRSNSASPSVPNHNVRTDFGAVNPSQATLNNATLSRSNSASSSVPTHNVRSDFGTVNPSQATLNNVTLSRSNSASPSVPTSNASLRSDFGSVHTSPTVLNDAVIMGSCTTNLLKTQSRSNAASPMGDSDSMKVSNGTAISSACADVANGHALPDTSFRSVQATISELKRYNESMVSRSSPESHQATVATSNVLPSDNSCQTFSSPPSPRASPSATPPMNYPFLGGSPSLIYPSPPVSDASSPPLFTSETLSMPRVDKNEGADDDDDHVDLKPSDEDLMVGMLTSASSLRLKAEPDGVIDLTWMDEDDIKVESPEFIEDDAMPLMIDNRECLCEKPAIYLCTCNMVMYCSQECQLKDWANHQRVCSSAAAASP